MKDTISAIITAGGNGIRFGGDKMLVSLKGKALILHTLEKFRQCKLIDEIIVLVKKENIKEYLTIINKEGLKVKIIPAAKERIMSVYYGVKEAKGKYIVTHDGNRPLTPTALINKLIEEVKEHKAVMIAISPTATIKYCQKNFVERSLPRNKTWIAQTPQAFERKILLAALEKAIKEEHFVATDDSELVTRLGKKVRIIPGDEINMKITFPHDLVIAEQLLNFLKT